MISLREITEENFYECIGMKVSEGQKSFVADNTYSLAEAWLYPKNARPFSIYYDETMVGFLMLDVNFHWHGDKNTCYLWRLMIDENHQGKGYGKAATKLAVQYLKENINPEKIKTSFVPSNEVAEKIYKNLGFVPTGEVDDGEIVMELIIERK
ncbi:MAG: GNAT family N-acetyltransferase [Defluviitaleaceae bacterium]|nr:GNAT family N-acetyltransferase [Defluviitaleaceae bacterium]